jgi:hypothetical protein
MTGRRHADQICFHVRRGFQNVIDDVSGTQLDGDNVRGIGRCR